MIRLAFLSILAVSQALPASTETLPGYDRFDLVAAHRARPVAASIWYPAANPTYRVPVGDGPIFDPTFAFVGPAIAEGQHPLVLVSHGSGGNADALGWLSAGLVTQGAVVVAVNHPGSTSGDSSPRRSVDLSARALDLRAALDAVLADPSFAPFIDARRIGVVGFSLGGTTALGLAGLRLDGAAQDINCATGPDAADCGFFLRGGVRFDDHPGFGGAGDATTLQDVLPCITLINLGDADRLAAVLQHDCQALPMW